MYLAVCMRLPAMSKQLGTLEIIGRDSSSRAGNSQQQQQHLIVTRLIEK